MPITSNLISKAIKAQMFGVGFKGRDMGKIANAVARSVFMHLSTPNITLATLSGTVGPMSSIANTAIVGIVPTAMNSLMKAKGVQNGFTGRDLSKLTRSISTGLSQVLMTMVLSGSSIGMGIGGGSSRFVGLNANALSSMIKFQLISLGFKGRDMSKIASMVASGVVTHLTSSATFPIIATGAIAPVPPAGPLPIAGVPSVFSKIS